MKRLDFDIAPETPGLFARDDYFDLLAALRRFPGFEVVGPPRWVRSTLVRGLDRLPVTMSGSTLRP